MKTYNLQDINNLNPCYNPIRYLPKDWSGTIIDILQVSDCTAEDRLWVATELLDDKTNRRFAVWCAREALKLIPNPDPRSINAINIAEKYADGNVTAQQLAAARAVANYAARDIASCAASYAASYTANYAASDAAKAAANYAARDIASYTAYAAASDAAWAAAWAAASDAAKATAWVAASAAQVEQLIKMLGAT